MPEPVNKNAGMCATWMSCSSLLSVVLFRYSLVVNVWGQAALTAGALRTGAVIEGLQGPSLSDTCCDNMTQCFSTATTDIGSVQEIESEYMRGQTWRLYLELVQGFTEPQTCKELRSHASNFTINSVSFPLGSSQVLHCIFLQINGWSFCFLSAIDGYLLSCPLSLFLSCCSLCSRCCFSSSCSWRCCSIFLWCSNSSCWCFNASKSCWCWWREKDSDLKKKTE